MSNSRLEKFIYAICGMEVDDLPTPLSRIEMLWNCLITGETPDFEPLSRNEKYLMSMLTGDVDALPEPTSRSEKLLYKIATGETDLTDVPGYLSRYEEILKYLIENGGFGGTDFEYVLYTLNDSFSTLYSTAEAPVKSAILKGNTESIIDKFEMGSYLELDTSTNEFGKLSSPNRIRIKHSIKKYVGEFTVSAGGEFQLYIRLHSHDTKKNTNLEWSNTHSLPLSLQDEFVIILRKTDDSELTLDDIYNAQLTTSNGVIEGMQSVKMPVLTTIGKNLMSSSLRYDVFLENDGLESTYYQDIVSKEFIQVESSTSYGIATFYQGEMLNPQNIFICEYDNGKNFIKRFNATPYGVFATDINTKYIKFSIGGAGIPGDIEERKKIFIELEKTKIKPTAYEPYKSNILTCNEEVILRGIGEVKDTLDGNTGELTQRIGEVVLDGSEDWATYPNGIQDNVISFMMNNLDNKRYGVAICDELKYFKTLTQGNGSNEEGFVSGTNNKGLTIYISKDKASSIETFKQWLSQNSITVQYELDTESVKTVDLSILDQDGQPTKLKTFNDITHVSIEAEDLLPTVDLEVPTKIEETLSTLPTLMNDISETQQSLNESIDDQAKNINEVSTAMTEIHNDIL